MEIPFIKFSFPCVHIRVICRVGYDRLHDLSDVLQTLLEWEHPTLLVCRVSILTITIKIKGRVDHGRYEDLHSEDLPSRGFPETFQVRVNESQLITPVARDSLQPIYMHRYDL